MGKDAGGTTTTNTTQSSTLPTWQTDAQKALIEQGLAAYNTPLQYNAKTYAPFTPAQESSFNYLTNRGNTPTTNYTEGQDLVSQIVSGRLGLSPVNLVDPTTNYNTEINKILGGGYLSPDTNPYLKSSVEASIRPVTENYQNIVMPGRNTSAVAAGRTSGSTQALLQAQDAKNYETSIGDLSNTAYSNAYNAERANMMNALGLSTGLAKDNATLNSQIEQNNIANRTGAVTTGNTLDALRLQDVLNMAGVGEQQRALTQSQLNEITASKDFQTMEPWKRLQLLQSLVNGNMGTTSTATQETPYYNAPVASQVLGTGLGLTGLGLGLNGLFNKQ